MSSEYVIVGAGSAGCVLASRLTAAGRSVTSLEAGEPDDDRRISVPAAIPKLMQSTYDWGYRTTPQSEMAGRELYWPCGRTLGGSSSINAMVWVWAHPSDYDDWAEVAGDDWRFDEMRSYLRRIESFDGGETRGSDGPLSVERPAGLNELSEALLTAAASIGHERNPGYDDPTGAGQTGVAGYQTTTRNGRRHSAADAYLTPALDRSNLTAITSCWIASDESPVSSRLTGCPVERVRPEASSVGARST